MWKHIVAQIYFLSFLKFGYCCDCNSNHTDGSIEKRHLEETTTELFTDKTAETDDLTDTSYYNSITTIPHSMFFESNETTTETHEVETNRSYTMFDENKKTDNIYDFIENSSDIVEFHVTEITFETINDLRKTETTTEMVKSVVKKTRNHQASNELWKKCRQYKNGDSFDLSKMADVWQVVYYRLANKLKCFKLHIKPVTQKERKRYAKVYGNFNETVDWNRCFLEITSNEKENKGRRHFLQGTPSDKGIMQNVIIDEEYCKNTTYLTLHRETGDQWLVIGKLLLMRDCNNGDFVVFTKVPLQPRKADIMDALKKFGMKNSNGTMACNVEKSWLKFDDGSYA